MGKKIEKTRNAGTMSESAFWGMIRATLRGRTRFWKPRLLALQKAKRKYTGNNPKMKWEYECYICHKYFPVKEVEVDHLKEVGKLTCKEDLPSFVENLFCEEENLFCVCKKCHLQKTLENKKKNGKE